ncbi:beta-eliminating lyase-related protein [Stappia sp.]|uniref:threonine aldolase family protein n=1 Tax=Stappia sp. TaxID=1870903 RepID=UPI0032D96F28
MMFASDNWSGASDAVMDALARHNAGFAPAYGADPVTERVSARFADLFDTDVTVLYTATGTAANALAMAACARPGGLIFASDVAHLHCDEWGAAEFYTHGMKIVPVAAEGGRMRPEDLSAALARTPDGGRFGTPTALSLTQATECGTLYTVDEVRALTDVARARGLVCHMDGARFANALATLDVAPADITWKAGIDVLSFGGTKNGCWCAEALVVFSDGALRDLATHRARAGHVFSKSRFVSAQFEGYLDDDHWLDLARHANAAAQRLAQGLTEAGVRIAWPVQANEVFPVLSRGRIDALKAHGVLFHEWSTQGCGPDEAIVRLVTSFRTTGDEVDAFLAAL